jgi:hypothetical protein
MLVAMSDDESQRLDSYPLATAEIVTEAQQRIRESMSGPEGT